MCTNKCDFISPGFTSRVAKICIKMSEELSYSSNRAPVIYTVEYYGKQTHVRLWIFVILGAVFTFPLLTLDWIILCTMYTIPRTY